MKVTIERVSSFNLRNLIGHDQPQEFYEKHTRCITDSTAIWLAQADGVDACALGVIPITIFSETAYLWLLHAKICEQHPLRFIRWSRRVLNEVLTSYPNLVGLCKCDHPHSQAWLTWLGAVFDRTSMVDGCYKFSINGPILPPS